LAGLIEKIPYLQQLGITAVELLPVFQFDAQDCPPGLVNYWGYSEPLDFELPAVDNGDANPWRRWIDTALDCPQDIVEWQAAPPVCGWTYRAEARSVTVLFARH
jgi:hypothetical protein